LGWEQLSSIRPELIMARISGFGQTGPYASRAGHASIGEAMEGLRALTGYPDLPPTRVGISIGDSLTGMFGALGALAALEARRRSGRGQVVDASIFESVLAVTESLVVDWHARGTVRERTGPTLPGIAPSNVYPTGVGHILIAANQDSVFRYDGKRGQFVVARAAHGPGLSEQDQRDLGEELRHEVPALLPRSGPFP
jgi:crotonobetainyl-CoA:carnitine CoA-transferase CaiB-like acyl-CoA transferase